MGLAREIMMRSGRRGRVKTWRFGNGRIARNAACDWVLRFQKAWFIMSSTDPAPQCCALCGAFFRCAQQTGDAQCWCAAFPALPAERLNPRMTCLCPDCLREETQRSINM